MSIKAVTFDAYGTLIRNEDLRRIAQRIVTDHRLSTPVDVVHRCWADLYYESTQAPPFRSLREMEGHVLRKLLRQFDVSAADPAGYVDLFFEITTKVELYPETVDVLNALRHLRSAIISNADHEHVLAWNFTLPVEFILISEAVGAYKPARLVFQTALDRLGLEPHEVLHVGDSDIDDVGGAKAAGLRVAWINRDGRARRPHVPAPDYEMRDLTPLVDIIS